MTTGYLQTRITTTQNLITAYEDAMLQLGNGSIQSYTLDTGQSRQTVTKLDMAPLVTAIDSLYNRLATLEARLNGSGVKIGAPSW